MEFNLNKALDKVPFNAYLIYKKNKQTKVGGFMKTQEIKRTRFSTTPEVMHVLHHSVVKDAILRALRGRPVSTISQGTPYRHKGTR